MPIQNDTTLDNDPYEANLRHDGLPPVNRRTGGNKALTILDISLHSAQSSLCSLLQTATKSQKRKILNKIKSPTNYRRCPCQLHRYRKRRLFKRPRRACLNRKYP